MKHSLIAAAMTAALSASAAQAAVIVNVQESGADVVIGYSGTIDLIGLSAPNSTTEIAQVALPAAGLIAYITGAYDFYSDTPISAAAHGTGGTTISATSASGDIFAFAGVGQLGLNPGYVSGDLILGSMIFAGSTLLSMGYDVGTYEHVLSNGDTITTNVGIAAVPLPAAAPMLLGALALTGFAARRRKG